MLNELVARAANARNSAHQILAEYGHPSSRVVLLGDLHKMLGGAPVDVQDYFREAISCLEHGLKRSAIVVAWAGFFQLFVEKLFANHESAMRAARPKWSFRDVGELKEQYPESQILDLAKEVKFHTNSELKVRQGQLSRRNQCAHPTLYRPSTNEAIGYVEEMITQALRYV